MLPFTTYNIPESSSHKTPKVSQWLGIILDKPLNGPEEDLLKKICTSLKADFSKDVILVDDPVNEGASISLLHSANIKLVISFGVLPTKVGIWIDLANSGIRYLESFTFILTKPLTELSSHPVAKKQLWSSMQSFMEINNEA